MVLALFAAIYCGAVALASMTPGPSAWGLHAAGFLAAGFRVGILGLLALGAALLFLDTYRRGEDGVPESRDPDPRRSVAARLALPALLLVLVALFWFLRARTQFLGDGTVWLVGIQKGYVTARNEPLAAGLWFGFSWLLRALDLPVTADTLGILSILCGAGAVAIAWGLARELAAAGVGRALALVLLLTLGVSQLYFGYIESYPPAAMFVLGYLWLGLRRARGAGSSLLLPAALALCVGGHFGNAALYPSYVYLVLRGPEPRWQRVALALAAPLLALGLLLAIGSQPREWLQAYYDATPGKAYGFFSLTHASEIMNGYLLILPIPLLLIAARLAGRKRGGPGATVAETLRSIPPDAVFLVLAALPGAALHAYLRPPLPPAQDWDLSAILLLPAAVLAIRAGRDLIASLRVPGRLGLAAVAIGSLLPFVLVNASEEPSVRRFATILAPEALIDSRARAYGNETLWKFLSERGQYERAHLYSLRALEADSNNARYWTNAGLDFYRRGRYEEALAYFQGAVQRGPTRWEARYDAGICLNAMARYREAADQLRLALRYGARERPEVWHSLGIALFRSGDQASAVSIWRQVAAKWPDYTKSLRENSGSAPPAP